MHARRFVDGVAANVTRTCIQTNGQSKCSFLGPTKATGVRGMTLCNKLRGGSVRRSFEPVEHRHLAAWVCAQLESRTERARNERRDTERLSNFI